VAVSKRAPSDPAPRPAPSALRLARTGEVLDLLRRGAAETTADLAATMGVARSTVTERLDLLFRHGLIVTVGETSGARGRPASRLAFNADAGVTLAAQVGMSGMLMAVTNLAADVRWYRKVDLDVGEGPEALLARLEEHFSAGLEELGAGAGRLYGIGIGMPGDLEIAGTGSTTAAWRSFPLADRLRARFERPVFVDRDVNFLALGEHRTSWPDARTFLCLKVGTVIACGLIIDGQVVRGATGLLGEVGHTKVHGHDEPCTCGSRGCLNTIAGGSALAAQLREHGFDIHTAREVSELANRGVLEAVQAVRAAGRQIGDVMAGAINLLNPDVIAVWGYLVDAGDQFLAGMQEAIYKTALPASARAVSLARSPYGDDAGLRGAALTVIEHTLKPEAIDAFVAESALAA
jgi:predicted NBD/HSP70 family sugar kinase